MDVLRSAGKSRMDKIRNKEIKEIMGVQEKPGHHRYYRNEKNYSGIAMSKECQNKDYLNLIMDVSQ